MRRSDRSYSLIHVVGEEEYSDNDGMIYENDFDDFVEIDSEKDLDAATVREAILRSDIIKSDSDNYKLEDLRFEWYEFD